MKRSKVSRILNLLILSVCSYFLESPVLANHYNIDELSRERALQKALYLCMYDARSPAPWNVAYYEEFFANCSDEKIIWVVKEKRQLEIRPQNFSSFGYQHYEVRFSVEHSTPIEAKPYTLECAILEEVKLFSHTRNRFSCYELPEVYSRIEKQCLQDIDYYGYYQEPTSKELNTCDLLIEQLGDIGSVTVKKISAD